jgi:pimeloyl-ACP methyl ester carboxylesterase
MAVFSELRYPTTLVGKMASASLALILFLVIGTTIAAGYLLRQVLNPRRSPATVDLNVMMGHPSTFTFSIGGHDRDGWFFPGLQGAPVIVVCHGYGSQRSDVLTLVTALQDQQYNVFVFDFTGHGAIQGTTTLGYKETGELRAAITALAGRADVDAKRFGLWGTDMGAYAALETAESDPRVAAVAMDSVYDDPVDMLDLEVKKTGLTALPFVMRFCEIGFHLINYQYRQEPAASTRLGRMQGASKLFIQSRDRPELAFMTFQLFQRAPDPKRQEIERVSYLQMGDDDRKSYENLIVSFFLQSLPAARGSAH